METYDFYLVNNESAIELFSRFGLDLVTDEYGTSYLVGDGVDMVFNDVVNTNEGIIFLCTEYYELTDEFADYISTLKLDTYGTLKTLEQLGLIKEITK